MPVIIEELTTTLEIRDEVKIRKLVREEIAHAMRDEQRKRAVGRDRVDPTDPAASGRPGQGGG